jgi:Cu/Ag efflux protein CusF
MAAPEYQIMRNSVPPFLTLAAALFLGAAAFAVDKSPSSAPTLQTEAPRAVLPDDHPLPRGRVVAIDETTGSITLEYRPIPQLFLEGGTRTFAVDDRSVLEGVAPGTTVRFDVERTGRRYTVTYVENAN